MKMFVNRVSPLKYKILITPSMNGAESQPLHMKDKKRRRQNRFFQSVSGTISRPLYFFQDPSNLGFIETKTKRT